MPIFGPMPIQAFLFAGNQVPRVLREGLWERHGAGLGCLERSRLCFAWVTSVVMQMMQKEMVMQCDPRCGNCINEIAKSLCRLFQVFCA